MFQIKCCVFNLSVLFFGLVGCFKVCSLPDLNLKQQFQVVKSVLLHFIPNSSAPRLQRRHQMDFLSECQLPLTAGSGVMQLKKEEGKENTKVQLLLICGNYLLPGEVLCEQKKRTKR